jgi:hypothetical protein
MRPRLPFCSPKLWFRVHSTGSPNRNPVSSRRSRPSLRRVERKRGESERGRFVSLDVGQERFHFFRERREGLLAQAVPGGPQQRFVR